MSFRRTAISALLAGAIGIGAGTAGALVASNGVVTHAMSYQNATVARNFWRYESDTVSVSRNNGATYKSWCVDTADLSYLWLERWDSNFKHYSAHVPWSHITGIRVVSTGMKCGL